MLSFFNVGSKFRFFPLQRIITRMSLCHCITPYINFSLQFPNTALPVDFSSQLGHLLKKFVELSTICTHDSTLNPQISRCWSSHRWRSGQLCQSLGGLLGCMVSLGRLWPLYLDFHLCLAFASRWSPCLLTECNSLLLPEESAIFCSSFTPSRSVNCHPNSSTNYHTIS